SSRRTISSLLARRTGMLFSSSPGASHLETTVKANNKIPAESRRFSVSSIEPPHWIHNCDLVVLRVDRNASFVLCRIGFHQNPAFAAILEMESHEPGPCRAGERDINPVIVQSHPVLLGVCNLVAECRTPFFRFKLRFSRLG